MVSITDKKRLLLSTVFILAIFLVSCKKSSDPTNSSDTNSLTSKAGGLAAALISGDSFRCKYTNSTDNSTGEYLVKNKSFRVDGQEVNGQQSSVIVNEKGMYMWTPGEKKGFFYAASKTTDTDDTTSTNSDFDEFLNPEKLDAKEKIDCQNAILKDSDFAPPTDVEFQDFSQMMNSFTNPNDPSGSLPNTDLESIPQLDQE